MTTKSGRCVTALHKGLHYRPRQDFWDIPPPVVYGNICNVAHPSLFVNPLFIIA